MVNLERDVVLFLHGDGWMDTEKNETWSGGSVVVDRERRMEGRSWMRSS